MPDMSEEKELSGQESLQLISRMISRARNSFHDTGIGPMLWGGVIAFCSLVTYTSITWDINLPFDIWLLTIVAIIPQIWISVKERKMRRARSHDDSVIDYVWISFGISIFLFTHINIAMMNRLHEVFRQYKAATGIAPAFRLSNYSSSVMLLLYGIPTVITGAIMRFKPMLWGGIAGWVFCIISVYTPIDIDMLLTAFAAIVMWLVPGIILWNRYKKTKEENV